MARIIIAEDHPMMRDALHDALVNQEGFEIIGEAWNGQQAVEMTLQLKPDIILMDLYMPVMNGIEATQLIMKSNPAVRVLVITSSTDEEMVLHAIRAGAMGYLFKSASRETILKGLRAISSGQKFIPSEVGEKLTTALQKEIGYPTELTKRETEIIELVVLGYSNESIAKSLVISESTVRVHVSNILHRLHLKNRTQLALYAQKKFRKLENTTNTP